MAMGDRMFWGYSKTYTDGDARAAFQVGIEAGVNFSIRRNLWQWPVGKTAGAICERERSTVVLGTKFMPFPWRFWKGALRSALLASLNRLEVKQVALYQIHWPAPPVSVETWMHGLADAVEGGLVAAVGVSNYNATQMRKAYAALSARGIRLASNQVEYSLLNRQVELNGLLGLCQELGVTLIAYSPLAKGLLTGKYSPENPPPGLRSRAYSRESLGRIQLLTRTLAKSPGAVTNPAQVALELVVV
jgi:aryl-alcohol dehydrogenase-like predicted oxidoreductase